MSNRCKNSKINDKKNFCDVQRDTKRHAWKEAEKQTC